MHRVAPLLAATLAVTAAIALPCGRDVAGYYPSWSRWIPFGPEQVAWDHVSIVEHAFVGISSEATVVEDPDFAATRAPLLAVAAEHATPVLASIGGWGGCTGRRLQAIAADPVARETLATNLADYCVLNGYAGVSLDWEFPGMLYASEPTCTPLGREPSACVLDRANLTLLSAAIRTRFDQVDPPLRMHVTLPISDWFGSCYDGAALDDLYDRLEIMAYDLHGDWAGHAGHNAQVIEPPEDSHGGVLSVTGALDYWILGRGVVAPRLLLGVPFYGYEYPAACGVGDPAIAGATYRPYREVLADYLDRGWSREFDDIARVPFLLRDSGCGFLSYDDAQSIAVKGALAVERSLGGAMVWELTLDHDATSGDHPLLGALAGAVCPYETNCADGIDDDGDGSADCADPDCAATTVCCLADPDGDCDADGMPNGSDCAVLDAGVFAPPFEVERLRATRSESATLWTWLDQSAATGAALTYDIVGGGLAPWGSGTPDLVCAGESSDEPSFLDDAPPPAAPAFALVRARNACGTGSYGRSVVDAASPCP